jgi:diketogulonate reductase-like aldo/keto reductase
MWKLMEKSLDSGKVKHIGISNFNVTQIEQLLASAKVKPYNHQIEAHPYLQDWKFYDVHQKLGIPLVAYAPLGNQNPEYHYRNWKSGGKLMLNDLTLKKIADARGCTTAQVALAWNLARGVTVIPKAFNPQNAIDNYEANTKCKLTAADLSAIRALDQNGAGGKRYWDMFCSMGLPGYYGLQDSPASGPVSADYCEDGAVKAAGLVTYDASRTDLWNTPKTVCLK